MTPDREPHAVSASDVGRGGFRHYDIVMAAFVTILLLSNVIGAGKRAVVDLPLIGPWPFGAGILFFPLSYLLGDVLTEVYGYAAARRCIWVGFGAMLFMVAMAAIVVALPPDAGWTGQEAYRTVFGQVWRIVFASIAAFWVGEFVNAYAHSMGAEGRVGNVADAGDLCRRRLVEAGGGDRRVRHRHRLHAVRAAREVARGLMRQALSRAALSPPHCPPM